MKRSLAASVMSIGLGAVCFSAEVKFDFETGDLQGWQVVDGKFGKLITDREQLLDGPYPNGKGGKYFLSTCDTPEGKPNRTYMGVIESPVILLSSPDISMRVTRIDWKSGVSIFEVGKNPLKSGSSRFVEKII